MKNENTRFVIVFHIYAIDTCTSSNVDLTSRNVQKGNDQEMAQSERKSHSKNRGGEKMN